MQQIQIILDKIVNLSKSSTSSRIEKDLMLSYTRDLYEAILNLETPNLETKTAEPEIVSEPEPIPIILHKENLPQLLHDAVFIPKNEEVILATVEKKDGREIITSIFEDDTKTIAENMDFVLEPELQEEDKKAFFKSKIDFKVWTKDIRTYIGINDKYNFISHLFSENQEAYEEILNEINRCENYKDALGFLENSGITTLYKWEEEGASEEIFYTILSHFFSSK